MNDTDHDTSPLSDASRPAPGQTDTTHPLDPKGRFTRLSWLAWTLVLGVASGLLLFGLVALGLVTLPEPDPQTGPPLAMGVGILVLQVIFLVLYLLLAIRRFHDINASGWWSALLILPLVNLVAWLVLAIKRGDDAANRFGPPRPTPTWERVLGIISIVLIVLGLIGTIAAIAIPAYLD